MTYELEQFPAAVTFKLKVADKLINGRVKSAKESAAAGETVQLTVPPALFIAYAPGRTADAIRLAMQLRRQGQRVKVATFAMDEAEVQNQARINKCDTFRYVKE